MTEDSCFLCCSPGSTPCPACNLVSFCATHKSKHFHNNKCLPYKICQNEEVGRHVVAVRDISPLELVLVDNPAVVGPKQFITPVCLACLEPVTGEFSCPSCQFPMCSSICSSSSIHSSNECSVFPPCPPIQDYKSLQPQFECVTPLRLLLLSKRDPDLWSELNLLMDHVEDRKMVDPEGMERERRTIEWILLQGCKLGEQGFTSQEVWRCVGLLGTNAITAQNKNGRAIYPTFSFISHSCANNSRIVVDKDNSMKVYSQDSILAGQEITITYINLLNDTTERRDLLKAWHFTCSCSRCLDATELGSFIGALKCQNCPNGFWIKYGKIWKCNGCSTNLKARDVEEILTITTNLLGTETQSIKKHETFLEKTRMWLHPHHYQSLITKRILSQLYGNSNGHLLHELSENRLQRKISLCNELLEVISKIDKGWSQFRGHTLNQLFLGTQMLLIKQAKVESAMELKKEDQDRLKEILEECIKCLSIERDGTPLKNVCLEAQKNLKMLSLIKL